MARNPTPFGKPVKGDTVDRVVQCLGKRAANQFCRFPFQGKIEIISTWYPIDLLNVWDCG